MNNKFIYAVVDKLSNVVVDTQLTREEARDTKRYYSSKYDAKYGIVQYAANKQVR